MSNNRETYDETRHPHLASWAERRQRAELKSMRCPACGRQGYKPYLYPDGTVISEECGRCDHESSCGYHVSPRAYFADHPDSGNKGCHTIEPRPVRQSPPRVEVPGYWISRLYCLAPRAGKNPLLRWWWQFFEEVRDEYRNIASTFQQRMRDALSLYGVGTLEHDGTGYTVWWIVDEDGHVRSGKAMRYLDNGHRDKTSERSFLWMHRLPTVLACQQPGAEYSSCLFGLHLLKRGYKQVQVVESEKTAVMMSVFRPDMCWMATMGMGNLNRYSLSPLTERGVTVVLHPDVDGYEKWTERAKEIRRECPQADIVVSDYVRRHTMPGDSPQADILDLMERDYMLMYKY